MLIHEKLWKPKNDFFSYLLRAIVKHSVQSSLPRRLLSAQKIYLFKTKLENSKQPRNFPKIHYVTTDDVYYYKRVLVLKVNFEFPLDYSKSIDISLNTLKLSV
jgi:hypothetical protein